MIPLKNAKLNVSIELWGGDYSWEVRREDKAGNLLRIESGYQYKTESGCKRNWENFAKTMGFKNWEYV